MPAAATVHATAVLAGDRAVLIRGPSGAGKSRLAFALIESARYGGTLFTRLVGDDRLRLEAINGRLLARPAEALCGLLELRGAGLMRVPFEGSAVVGLVVDLASPDAARFPEAYHRQVVVEGVTVPRLAVAPHVAALPLVLALINSADYRSHQCSING